MSDPCCILISNNGQQTLQNNITWLMLVFPWRIILIFPHFLLQQFCEYLCWHWHSVVDWHCIQFHSLQGTLAGPECGGTQLFIACILLYFCGLHCCSGVKASNAGCRAWWSKTLGLGYLCIFHAALDYFRCALFPQSVWNHMKNGKYSH